jgi:hypothetical protein
MNKSLAYSVIALGLLLAPSLFGAEKQQAVLEPSSRAKRKMQSKKIVQLQ